MRKMNLITYNYGYSGLYSDFGVRVLMKTSPILLSLAALSLIAPRLHAEAEIDILRDEVRSLKLRVFAMEASSVMALAPFVTVDPHPELGMVGPNIIFHGANIHIQSGSGRTDENGRPRGLGNLVIGYNELVGPSPRGGSHNLIMGEGNSCGSLSYGCIISGSANSSDGPFCSILTGANSEVSGSDNAVLGGTGNSVTGNFGVVVGGGNNSAGDFCVVLGGDANEASGSAACVVGGFNNGADAEFSVVLGTQNINNIKPFTLAP
jgi:hypothetical protein